MTGEPSADQLLEKFFDFLQYSQDMEGRNTQDAPAPTPPQYLHFTVASLDTSAPARQTSCAGGSADVSAAVSARPTSGRGGQRGRQSQDGLAEREAKRLERKRQVDLRARAATRDELHSATERVAELQEQLQQLQVENEALKLRQQVLDNALQLFSRLYSKVLVWKEQVGHTAPGMEGQNVAAWLPPNIPTGKDDTQQMSRLATMTVEEMCAMFKSLVFEAAELLLKSDEEVEAGCSDMFLRTAIFCDECTVVNLRLMSTAWVINLETGQPLPADSSHWRRVAKGLGLTDEQVKQAVLLKAWFADQFQAIAPQAIDLTHRLDSHLATDGHSWTNSGNHTAKGDSLTGTGAGIGRNGNGGTGSGDHNDTMYVNNHSINTSGSYGSTGRTLNASEQPDTVAMFNELQLLTKKFGFVIRLAKHAMFHKLFTRRQSCMVLVTSWPYITDPAGLLTALAELPRTAN